MGERKNKVIQFWDQNTQEGKRTLNGSNRKQNRNRNIRFDCFEYFEQFDRIVNFSNRCHRFGLNIMLKPTHEQA